MRAPLPLTPPSAAAMPGPRTPRRLRERCRMHSRCSSACVRGSLVRARMTRGADVPWCSLVRALRTAQRVRMSAGGGCEGIWPAACGAGCRARRQRSLAAGMGVSRCLPRSTITRSCCGASRSRVLWCALVSRIGPRQSGRRLPLAHGRRVATRSMRVRMRATGRWRLVWCEDEGWCGVRMRCTVARCVDPLSSLEARSVGTLFNLCELRDGGVHWFVESRLVNRYPR